MDHTCSGVPRDMSYHFLEEITDGFSEERTLGSGAYGKVYMGVHKDGDKIAVKMLYERPGLDDTQFQNEFYNLAKLQHQNIVRLVGYCYEIQKKYVEYNGRLVFADKISRALCLEYMHNGSLDKYLSDEYHGLDWNTRYAIIKGICSGLKYLHEELKSPIYHLDLKPANILLDENMVPRIADFGLSRLFGEEQSQVITKSFIGTRGYIPPEYIERNVISTKFDIFSLGVVIIKIMTGPAGYSKSAQMSGQRFIDLVHENWRNRLQGTPVYMIDSYYKQVKKCIKIALSCVQVNPYQRPSIGNIIEMLNLTETMIHKSELDHWLRYGPSSSLVQISTGLTDALKPAINFPPPSSPVPRPGFDHHTLQQRFQAVFAGSGEPWTYAIFWKSSIDTDTESLFLSWGAGYWNGGSDDDDDNHRWITPTAKAEQEHRKRVRRDLSTLVSGDEYTSQWRRHRRRGKVGPLPRAHSHKFPSSTLSPTNPSSSGGGGIPGNAQAQPQAQADGQLALRPSHISGKKISAESLPWNPLNPGYGATDTTNNYDDEWGDVADTEWFFIISMAKTFAVGGGSGLPGQAQSKGQPIWLAGGGLSGASCAHARQAYNSGFRTMACVPLQGGVLELGSTDAISRTPKSLAKIQSFFDKPLPCQRSFGRAEAAAPGTVLPWLLLGQVFMIASFLLVLST